MVRSALWKLPSTRYAVGDSVVDSVCGRWRLPTAVSVQSAVVLRSSDILAGALAALHRLVRLPLSILSALSRELTRPEQLLNKKHRDLTEVATLTRHATPAFLQTANLSVRVLLGYIPKETEGGQETRHASHTYGPGGCTHWPGGVSMLASCLKLESCYNTT